MINSKEKELLKELEQRFGAEIEKSPPDEDETKFLEKRDELAEILNWNFDAFVEHFQLIKNYGLEDKLLEQLAYKIEHFLDTDQIEALKSTKFYHQFGKYEIIEKAFLERNQIRSD